MKDRIVFSVLGILVIVIILIIADRVNNPVAQTNTQIFDNVLIRGKLTITDGDTSITLENKEGNSNIILDTKGSIIMLSAEKDNALVILSDDIQKRDKLLGLPKGISLFTSDNKRTGHTNSIIYLSDDAGKNMIGTE